MKDFIILISDCTMYDIVSMKHDDYQKEVSMQHQDQYSLVEVGPQYGTILYYPMKMPKEWHHACEMASWCQ